MGKIVSIANSKGGSGKSTMTIFLSSVLSKMGKRVIIIDSDEQESILDSFELAKELGDKILFDVVALDPEKEEFFDLVDKYKEEYDYVFIDMPGRGHDKVIKKIILSLEYAIVPFGYGDTDISATYKFISNMIEFKKKMNEQGFDIKIGIFFNDHKTNTLKSKDTMDAVVENYKKSKDVKILDNNGAYAVVATRDIYKTLEFGHTPLELKRSYANYKAIDEFEHFVKSVIKFVEL